MSHPLLSPSAISWGARYTTALNALLDAWKKALANFEGETRIDIQLFTQDFMESNSSRPLISTFIYHIKNDMNEYDVEDMLLDIGKKEKGISEE